MALADHLKASGPRTDRLTLILDGIEGEDRAVLIAALRDPGYTHADIGKALRAVGHDITNNAIGDFRRNNKKMGALK